MLNRQGDIVMFEINDYVVYGSMGVYRIIDITKEQYNGNEAEYYVLQPVYNDNMTIKTPVNNPNALMRPIITKDD
jgi:CarD family transcriptional regulator